MGSQRIRPIKIIILISVILACSISSGCVRSFEEESYYDITDMDISAERTGAAFVDLNVTTYIEKDRGSPAGKNTSLLLKAYSLESGLLVEQKELELGGFEKRETRAVSQALSLPKTGSYELQVVLFEEKTRKSSGEIKVYSLEALPADVQEIGIGIPEMDFIVRGVKDGKVLIESDIYLTNEGRAISSDYRMLVKARELDAGLLADKVWTKTGKIESQTTVIRSVNLTIPDQYNYLVEVLVWNNNTIVKRGEGHIRLSPEIELKDEKPTAVREIETGEFERDEDFAMPKEESLGEEAMPGFGIFCAVFFLFLAGSYGRRTGEGRSEENRGRSGEGRRRSGEGNGRRGGGQNE
ncbi:MAG: hypothetical protein PHV51_01610 [Methanosarcinaceae archaeon]|nr:hypothetical protein [Methanosarcinaceae archaeon]